MNENTKPLLKTVTRNGRQYLEETEETRTLYDDQMTRDGMIKREVGQHSTGAKVTCYERDWSKKNEKE